MNPRKLMAVALCVAIFHVVIAQAQECQSSTTNVNSCVGAVGKSTPTGFTDDFAAACAEASKSGKMVLAVFDGSDWCHWSKVFEKNHLSKPEFVKDAKRDFVLVFIDNPRDKSLLSDVAKQNNERLFKKYEIKGVPTVKILNADGSEVATASAGNDMTSKDYVEWLRQVAKSSSIVKKHLSVFEDEIKRAKDDAATVMIAMVTNFVGRYKTIRAKVEAANIPAEIEDERKALLNRIDVDIDGFERLRSKNEENVKIANKSVRAKDSRRPESNVQTDMVITPGLKTVYLDEFARKMKLVDIPDGVERIARKSGGYYPDSTVEAIKIPASVKRIDSHAIVGFWHRLERIEAASGSPYVVTNGCLIDTRDSSLVFALSGNTQIVVPNFVKSILDYAFEGNDTMEVKLAEGLEKIGNQAFTHCSSLERINIPSTVKRIGRGVFNFCGKLRNIDVSAGNQRFRACDGFLIDVEMDRLLRAWGDDDVMEIPAGVNIIGEYAFSSMDSLEVVKVPDSVELVEKYAFGWCDNLMRIKIPREELRSQIVEEIRDYRYYGSNGERKTRLGVNGSPKLLPSQILVVGGSGISVKAPNNHADNVSIKQKKD